MKRRTFISSLVVAALAVTTKVFADPVKKNVWQGDLLLTKPKPSNLVVITPVYVADLGHHRYNLEVDGLPKDLRIGYLLVDENKNKFIVSGINAAKMFGFNYDIITVHKLTTEEYDPGKEFVVYKSAVVDF